MRNFLKLLVCAALVATSFGVLASGDSDSSRPYQYATIFIPRSAGADNLVLNAHWLGYRPLNECFYAQGRVNYMFEQNFHGNRLARGLFDTHELLFQGSDITGDARSSQALLADYFGLSTKTNAKLSLCPRIRNNIISFNLFLGLSPLLDGLYFQLDAPVVHTSWHLQRRASKGATTTLPDTAFLPGYMDDMFTGTPYDVDHLKTVVPLTSFEDALNGKGFGKVAPWTYGKFFEGKHDATKLAAVNIDIGYHVP